MFRSLSVRFFSLILGIALLCLGGLAWFEVKNHTAHLEEESIRGAQRLSDTIRRSTRSSMLNNRKEDVYEIIQNVAAQPGIERIRLFKRTGHIRYTTDTTEVGSIVDVEKEACLSCHQNSQTPSTNHGCRARTRIFVSGNIRVLGLITPVYNEDTCTGASCHASVTDEPILGVLDVHLSLQEIDDTLLEQNQDFLLITYALMLGLASLCGLFVWQFVHKPVHALIKGTAQLSKGNLSHRISIQSHTEIGCLADSFNQMANELELAQQQLTDWAHTLEKRVEEKTNILKQAQTKLVQHEKMASLGTLSAAVAHEINNPLSGVLTYTRLLRKLLDVDVPEPERLPDMRKYLEVIASEVSRCGKIVSNLLDFSRQSDMRIAPADLNKVLDRALFLIGHKLKLQNIQLHQDLLPNLPHITCDADQIQQALLALLLNAIEALPDGGNIRVTTRKTDKDIQIVITDTGVGMSPSQMAHIFEPFYTTKSALNGVGLGLAIVYGIIHRHKGHIDVQSEEGLGTTFEISLPIAAQITEYDTSQFEGAVL